MKNADAVSSAVPECYGTELELEQPYKNLHLVTLSLKLGRCNCFGSAVVFKVQGKVAYCKRKMALPTIEKFSAC
jgi:hypothetical protein